MSPDVTAKAHPTVEEQRNRPARPWAAISTHQSALTERWNGAGAGR
jgi:hypothetical protein